MGGRGILSAGASRLTEEQLRQVRDLAEAGSPVVDIASTLGMPASTFRYALTASGYRLVPTYRLVPIEAVPIASIGTNSSGASPALSLRPDLEASRTDS